MVRSWMRPETGRVALVRVNAGADCRIARFCATNSVPFFLPLILTRKRHEGVSDDRVEFLWPNYVVARLDKKTEEYFTTIPGVQAVVFPSNQTWLIEQLRDVGRLNAYAPALSGMTGLFDSVDDSRRVLLLLNMLGRQLRVRVPAEHVLGADDLLQREFRSLVKPGPLTSLDEMLDRILAGDKAIADVVSNTNRELIAFLKKRPEEIYEISPTKFEDVIAEILSEMGYDIRFTPRGGGDGGRIFLQFFRRLWAIFSRSSSANATNRITRFKLRSSSASSGRSTS